MLFLPGLFLGELVLGGAYYWKEFCVSKWVGHDNKNSVKHYENSLKQPALTGYGLIFGRAGASEGLIFRRAYFWEGGLSEFYGKLNCVCGCPGVYTVFTN